MSHEHPVVEIELGRRVGETREAANQRISRAVPLPEPDRACAHCGVNVLLHHLGHLTTSGTASRAACAAGPSWARHIPRTRLSTSPLLVSSPRQNPPPPLSSRASRSSGTTAVVASGARMPPCAATMATGAWTCATGAASVTSKPRTSAARFPAREQPRHVRQLQHPTPPCHTTSRSQTRPANSQLQVISKDLQALEMETLEQPADSHNPATASGASTSSACSPSRASTSSRYDEKSTLSALLVRKDDGTPTWVHPATVAVVERAPEQPKEQQQ